MFIAKKRKSTAHKRNCAFYDVQPNFIRDPSPEIFLQFSYVSCLRTTVTFRDFKFYFLTFIQSLEAVALNCGEMYENVFAAFSRNKTITFLCVKPFNCTLQVNNLLKIPPSVANIHIILHHFQHCNRCFEPGRIICFSLPSAVLWIKTVTEICI